MSGQLFTVELTEAQLLNAWCQSKLSLDKTLDDIKRGRCTAVDVAVQRSLYSALCKIVYTRPRTSPISEGGAP